MVPARSELGSKRSRENHPVSGANLGRLIALFW